jgi:hypothetical protein
VAARNELAKQLRRDKQRDDATAVAALRRPGWDEWALNVTAVEQASDVAAFADAALAVRAAQAAAIEGREGADVRTTLHDLRDATAVLVRHASGVLGRVGRQAGPGELAGRLAEVAGSEASVEQLRIGVLGAGGDAPAELFAGLEPGVAAGGDEEPTEAAASARLAPAPRPQAGDAGDVDDAEDADDGTDEEPAPPRRDARAERAARRRRKEAVQAATQARREAATVADRAADAVDVATTGVRRAERALAEAERALADATAEQESADAALAAADAELEEARAAVDDAPA